MRRIIKGFIHQPGSHCASTAISDVMTFLGHDMSEALCFGLGCGLGFAYFKSDLMSPTRMTATRSRMLEPRFFENLGLPFEWKTDPDPEHALAEARNHIDRQTPVLLRADLKHLHYYNSNTSFPPHVIALWGYDDEAGAALIADTGWEELQEVPYQDLTKARYGGNAYVRNQAEHFLVDPDSRVDDLAAVARKALLQQARDLFGLDLDIPAVFGLEGMKKAAEEMPSWGEAKDWQWCARWLYQVIEKRGTGGGAFRKLYSLFCEELAGLDGLLAEAAPSGRMAEIAADWSALSDELKSVSEKDAPDFGRAAQMLGQLARDEEDFFRGVTEKLES